MLCLCNIILQLSPLKYPSCERADISNNRVINFSCYGKVWYVMWVRIHLHREETLSVYCSKMRIDTVTNPSAITLSIRLWRQGRPWERLLLLHCRGHSSPCPWSLSRCFLQQVPANISEMLIMLAHLVTAILWHACWYSTYCILLYA